MKKVISAALVVFLLTSLSLFAQPMGKSAFLQNNIKSKLKLTPDQEKQFDDITYKQQQAAIDIRSQIQKNRLDLKKMISDKNLDETKVLQLTDENSKLQSDLKHAFVQRWLDIYKILNDDQKAIFLKGLSKLTDGSMMHGKMGRMGMKSGMMGRGMMQHKGMTPGQTPQNNTNN